VSEIPFFFFNHQMLGRLPSQVRRDARSPIARGRCNLMGMPLNSVSEEETLEILDQRISRGQGTWVLTPNLDILRQYHTNPRLRSLFHADEGGADLLLADGMPLIWASRLAGHPLPERVPGSGLVMSLAHRASQKGWSIFLLGGAPGAAERSANVLTSRFAGLKIAGTCCPEMGFEKDSARLAAIRDQLVAAKPDIIYVALGFPKQELVTRYLRASLPNATFIGVGISLSFLAGDVKRAPRWVQRAGLEWVHRLVQEPRRLARRYLVHDAPFALLHLFPRALAERWNRADKRPVHLADWRSPDVLAPRRDRAVTNPREFSEGRADYEGYHSRRRPGHAPQSAHQGH
jgi:N-acetylglucosaminyldiphosphoundecaprenol N-acetyl-beta-D-mannosaminyltransferase